MHNSSQQFEGYMSVCLSATGAFQRLDKRKPTPKMWRGYKLATIEHWSHEHSVAVRNPGRVVYDWDTFISFSEHSTHFHSAAQAASPGVCCRTSPGFARYSHPWPPCPRKESQDGDTTGYGRTTSPTPLLEGGGGAKKMPGEKRKLPTDAAMRSELDAGHERDGAMC